MSKITAATDISQLKPEDFSKFVDLCLEDIALTVNGNLDFDTNFNGKEITAKFINANTDTSIAHGLGRVPSRYIVTSATAAMSVYSGTVSNNSSTITLRSSAVGTVTVLIY